MEKFKTILSQATPISIQNIDTDQIIPARFLKAISREGFGDNLFRDWRYDGDDNPVPDFPLNKSDKKNKILIAGRNFGCGSSREHAAWALYDFGFRVIVSSFFADIFNNNALNNGILTVCLDEKSVQNIFQIISENKTIKFMVDLGNQLFLTENNSIKESFEINQFNKSCLINGFDNIDFLRSKKNLILEFEQSINR